MSLFDVILVCILVGFTIFGLWFGIVSTLGSLAGTVFGVYLASRWYVLPASWLANTTHWSANFCNVVTFVILYLIINRLVGFVFYIIDRTFSIVTGLPFFKSLNHILGAALGLFEGFVALGITFYFISRFPLGMTFMAALSSSKIAPFCLNVASALWPFVPEAVRILQNTLQNIIK